MTASIDKSQQIFEKDCEVDRILCLPTNVIERIIDFMPVRDAARTCILSSKWRYVWADHHSLILDKDFWDDISQNRLSSKFHSDYAADIVNNILLHHIGYIEEFSIDVSDMESIPHSKIDLWLSVVCSKRVKKLGIRTSYFRDLYKVPLSVFSNSDLAHLSLRDCIISVQYTFGCFKYIQTLILERVNLHGPIVLTTPLLTSLTVERCRGVRDFNASAPRLASLSLHDNDYLNLKPFLKCKGITDALIYSVEETECHEGCERINLQELLVAWPRISELVIDGFCFKYLATGNIPYTLQLNLRSFALIEMDLDAEMAAWILCILKNSPLLHTFEIWFSTSGSEEVNEPSLMDYRFEQLKTIKMKYFTASKVQVMFVKMLLQCAPAVRKMLVEEDVGRNPNDQIKTLENLLVLQQASPKAQIVFGPGLLPT